MIFSYQEHQIDELFISIGPNSIQNLVSKKFRGETIENNLAFRSYVYTV